MSGPAVALSVAGPVAVAGAWLLVRRGASLWLVNGTLMPILGILALAIGEFELTRGKSATVSVPVGVAAGIGLYLATRAFMAVASRWAPLSRHAAALYENRGAMPLWAEVAIAAFLVAIGEELLWRGLVVESLEPRFSPPVLGAALAWLAYVVANAFSGSIPVVLGAVVGGAAWTALAVTGYGVAASMGCHTVWTGLMVVFPPIRRPL
jgi:membrane protease YdiL (CAAX protease family)